MRSFVCFVCFVLVATAIPVLAQSGKRRAVAAPGGVEAVQPAIPRPTNWAGVGAIYKGVTEDGYPNVDLVPTVPEDGILRGAVLNCDRDEVGDDFVEVKIPIRKKEDGTWDVGIVWLEFADVYAQGAAGGTTTKTAATTAKPVFWARSAKDGAYYSYRSEMAAFPDWASAPCGAW